MVVLTKERPVIQKLFVALLPLSVYIFYKTDFLYMFDCYYFQMTVESILGSINLLSCLCTLLLLYSTINGKHLHSNLVKVLYVSVGLIHLLSLPLYIIMSVTLFSFGGGRNTSEVWTMIAEIVVVVIYYLVVICLLYRQRIMIKSLFRDQAKELENADELDELNEDLKKPSSILKDIEVEPHE